MIHTLVLVCLVMVLLVLAYEDFKERAVHLWLFPLLAVVVLFYEVHQLHWENIFINVMVLLVQLVVLTIYFSIKNKQLINITKAYLGLGDILFWVVLCCLFSPLNFIAFYMFSLCITALCAFFLPLSLEGKSKIPLAGIQALVLIPCLVLATACDMSLRNDGLMLEWLIL